VLVADETGLPAVAGILRDLSREAVGTAMIARRDLVAKGVAKKSITFSGYWRLGADPHQKRAVHDRLRGATIP